MRPQIISVEERIAADPLFVERADELFRATADEDKISALRDMWYLLVRKRVEEKTGVVEQRTAEVELHECCVLAQQYSWNAAYMLDIRSLPEPHPLENPTKKELAIARQDQVAIESIANAAIAVAKTTMVATAKAARGGRGIGA